jgi:glycosyltransferase involved in cell wall biosynthesis
VPHSTLVAFGGDFLELKYLKPWLERVEMATINARVVERETDHPTQNTTKTTTTYVVAAIPCFNTERSIAQVVRRTRKYVDDVIVVDDGSRDLTGHRARAAGAIVVEHDTNRGYGEAIKSCLSAGLRFGADILVIIDGDGQHNPDEIPALLTPVLRSTADVVLGSRFLVSSSGVPRYRSFGIKAITFLWNLGSKTKVSDSQSGFRVFNVEAVRGLYIEEKGMPVSIEILEQLRKNGNVIREIPISCSYEDNNTRMNLKAVKHGLSVAFSVIKLRLKYNLFKEAGKLPGPRVKLQHVRPIAR